MLSFNFFNNIAIKTGVRQRERKWVFSVRKIFERKIFNSVVGVSSFFLFLKVPMTRRLYGRAVSTLSNTKGSALPRLRGHSMLVQFPLSAIIFTFFKILVNPFLIYDTKNKASSTNFEAFRKAGFFLGNFSLSDLTEANRQFKIIFKNLTKFFCFSRITEKSSKFKNRPKILTANVKKLTFFSVFGYNFFFITLFSPVSENAMIFRKHFYWHVSFCDIQIEGILKKSITIEFPLCCNSFCSSITRLKSFIQFTIRIILPVKENCLEKSVVLGPASQSP